MPKQKHRFHSKLRRVMLERAAADGEQLTQQALAERTGVSRVTINRWCMDNVERFEPHTVGALMDFFHCSLDELIEVILS